MPLRITLLALLLTLVAPQAAEAVFREFRSPSGKLGCAFVADARTPAFVRCDWRGSEDEAVQVGRTGRARIKHVTDTVLNPDAPVLRYGHSTRFRGLRCRSRRSGITCRSLRSGHGFRVSVERRELF
jgi:hypothetical protein